MEIPTGQLVGLLTEHYAIGLTAIITISLIVFVTLSWRSGEPQNLIDPIPYVYNTIQFLTNNERFMDRVRKVLKDSNLAKFYLGTTPVYLVSGPRNIQTIFARGHRIVNEDVMLYNVFPALYRMPRKDLKRFADDKSGRGKIPAPGTENTPHDQRYWSAYEHVHSEYLARTQHLEPMIKHYYDQFSGILDQIPISDSWATLGVTALCRHEIADCTISTLLGPKVFALNPGFRDAFWDFDNNVFTITLGFPRWLDPRPYYVQDRFLAMMDKYLDAAWANFDWNGPDAEAAWEPHFGARVSREIVKWLRESGFHERTGAGALAALLFAQNSNSIPTTIWMIIEVVKDPSLFQAIREEVSTAYTTDASTNVRTLDFQKLTTLPLLQSVYTEVLRLHVSFNIMRNTKELVTMDGFTFKTGSTLQAPMAIAHYDETVWGVAGYPASVFWAERHIKYTEEKDDNGGVHRKRVFAMAGRPSSFFPFGGGAPICPGRHFAKAEILMTIGLLVSKFDIEFVEWTKLDGSPSDRPARNDERYSGAGAMPPDRDMKIRWKRIQ
ncbi:putative cytochrome P450 [Xylogone sp. PMI_703]|nr:putative cytochrome P450 [Xylogone sp. PMI_703]